MKTVTFATLPSPRPASAGEPQRLAGLRVGWASEPAFGPVDGEVTAPPVEAAADALRGLGCVVEPAAPAGLENVDATTLSAVLYTAEIVPYFRKAADGRVAELGAVLQRTLAAAPEVEPADYVAAQQQVERLSSLFAGYFERTDALLCPVCPIPAPPHALSSSRPAVPPSRHAASCGFSPRFRDLDDQRLWRATMPGVETGTYGSVEDLARNRVNLNKVITHRPDMLKVAGSLVTNQVRAYDLRRMFGCEGRPTPLGAGFAECGRIAKTGHLLRGSTRLTTPTGGR